MNERFRKWLARAIIIDRATPKSTSFIGRIARERSEENYRFAGKFVAGKKVLDIGGGTGIGHDILVARGASSIVSLDLHVTSAAQNDSPVVQSIQGNFLTYPLAEESFDMIICLGTIFYIGDSDAALAKMHRILKPGGMLIINCINQLLVRRYFKMPLEKIDGKFSIAFDRPGFQTLLQRHFQAEPELFVQQPVPVSGSFSDRLAFWFIPLTWPFRRHPVGPRPPKTEGMYIYAVANKSH